MILFILYVADQERSKAFYSAVLDQKPSLHVPGMTEFILSPGCKLGLMPENGIATILTNALPHPSTGNGVPRCELYVYTDHIAEYEQRLHEAGGKMVSAAQDRDWGDRVSYYADPDGHIIAFAQKLG